MKLALILIDIQKGFTEQSYWGPRNNNKFEQNTSNLLSDFRRKNYPTIHVQHLSMESESPLRPELIGSDFMEFAVPFGSEMVFQKSVNSAFIGTNLEDYLRGENITDLVFAGLTTDHCVSTSVRMAANLGFKVVVAHDATATFDRYGLDGQLYEAELVHKLSLASLKNEFAQLKSTFEICN